VIAIIKALTRIASNLQRIREILEIVHYKELYLHDQYKKSKSIKEKDSDREFFVKESTDMDEYGEAITHLENNNEV